MRSKVKIGDVFPVLTSKGVAYCQVTHKHPEYGFLIRVFSGFHDADFLLDTVVDGDVLFSSFFPVQTAVNQGLFTIIGNARIPEKIAAFPIFRSRNGGAGGSIWFWDGEKSLRVDRVLTPEENQYPVEGVISAPLLVARIEKQYRASLDQAW